MSSYKDYLSDEEIAAHESAMHAVRDKRAAAEQGLRDEIERLQKELEERLAREFKAILEQEEIELEGLIVERERRIVLRRIYNEAPNDIMELIVKLLSDVASSGWGKGGMNVLRLVSKRIMGVVESCATRLACAILPRGRRRNPRTDYNERNSFPHSLSRCMRLQHIMCHRGNLKSLEGCPVGLQSLYIGDGQSLESLEPLRGCTDLESLEIHGALKISDLNPLYACTRLKKLTIYYSKVTDITTLSSMLFLEELDLSKEDDMPSIKDLSPLSKCKRLINLDIRGNRDIEKIYPLALCVQLEVLNMWDLIVITDIRPLSSLSKLKDLLIYNVPVEDLTPLSALHDLERLWCQGIPPTTSLLPLARCSKLKALYCREGAKDLDVLQERRIDISILN